MANKYRKRSVAPAAPSEAPAEAPQAEGSIIEGLKSIPEAFAQVGRDIAEIPGGVRAAAEQLPTAVPGGQYAVDKLRMALGESGEEIASKRAELEKEHPIGTAMGDVSAMMAGGAVLPGGKAASAVGRMAESAAQMALLTPAYKLGQTADQAQLKGDALHTESIANAFSLGDILTASGIAALLGAPAAGAEALAGVKPRAAAAAEAEAAKLFPKSAQALGTTPEALGQTAIQKSMLKSETATKKLLQDAGKRIGDAAAQAKLGKTDIDQMAMDLLALEQQAQNNQFLTTARKQLRTQAARLLNVTDGTELESIIQSFKGEARAAYKSGKAQKGQFYGDAAEALRGRMANHLDIVDPEIGAQYRSAVQDYNTYVKMGGEAAAGARKQMSLGTVGKAAARAAVPPMVGGLLGGPAGAAAGLALDVVAPAGILSPLRGKNKAVLLDRIAKAAPGAQHSQRAVEVLDHLLGVAKAVPRALAERKPEEDVHGKYKGMAKALRNSMADPSGTAQKMRAQLDFLPPHVADAVTANCMNKLQCLALELPPERGPATAFGITTDVPERAKREFLRKAEDKFDPYGAVLSGSPTRVKNAEQYNPETINDLRKRLVQRLAEQPDLDYSTKRRVTGILGVAGVPTQDPMVGATLQQIMRKRREAHGAQGQMRSARQANANLKNNSATLTRAQKILNNGE